MMMMMMMNVWKCFDDFDGTCVSRKWWSPTWLVGVWWSTVVVAGSLLSWKVMSYEGLFGCHNPQSSAQPRNQRTSPQHRSNLHHDIVFLRGDCLEPPTRKTTCIFIIMKWGTKDSFCHLLAALYSYQTKIHSKGFYKKTNRRLPDVMSVPRHVFLF